MFAVIVLAIGLGAAVQAGPPASGCERCHVVLNAAPPGSHLAEWTRSAHAAHRVGCVRCHDGDADSDDPVDAHRFSYPPAARSSSVHRSQLPATCGQCHPREATRFTASRHGALLASGSDAAPSCSSCHGSMNARVPAPDALQAGCAACHLDDPGHETFPSDARVLVEWIATARDRLQFLALFIASQPDDTTRRLMWGSYDRAMDRVAQAVAAMHGFDLAAARSAMMLARSEMLRIEQRGARTTH